MKVGLLSDVHGNLVALKAVLADMPSVDALACAGDVVGYNPYHEDCVTAMRGEGVLAEHAQLPDGAVPTVMGNHDHAVADDAGFAFNSVASAGVEHARTSLSETSLDWLSSLPTERHLFDGRVKVVHGHPDDPDRYTYPDDFSPRMLGDEDVLVLGHTHVQHHETFEAGIVVNPGSVGQPRDRDPRAAYAVLHLDEPAVEQRRVEYDVERVQQAVSAAGLPRRIGTRLLNGQ
ncbi:MAG: metallophosphoesterase [Haloarculaceae archaeon]